jgi:multidrug transporter EmrE-like cation transporter
MIGYLLVATTVLLTVYGQFVIKWQVAMAGPIPVGLYQKAIYIFHLLTNPWIASGLLAALVASVAWMLALTKLPLSVAYPFTAFAFVIVVLGSGVLFAEPISTAKMLGVCLIVAGIVVAGLN